MMCFKVEPKILGSEKKKKQNFYKLDHQDFKAIKR